MRHARAVVGLTATLLAGCDGLFGPDGPVGPFTLAPLGGASLAVVYGDPLPSAPVAEVRGPDGRPAAGVRVRVRASVLTFGGATATCRITLPSDEIVSNAQGRLVLGGRAPNGPCTRGDFTISLAVAADTGVNLLVLGSFVAGPATRIGLGEPQDTVLLAFGETLGRILVAFDRFGNQASLPSGSPWPTATSSAPEIVQVAQDGLVLRLRSVRSGRASLVFAWVGGRDSVALTVLDSATALATRAPTGEFIPVGDGALVLRGRQVFRLAGASWDSTTIPDVRSTELTRDVAVAADHIAAVTSDVDGVRLLRSFDVGQSWSTRTMARANGTCVAAHPTVGSVLVTWVGLASQQQNRPPEVWHWPRTGEPIALASIPVTTTGNRYIVGCDVAVAPDGSLLAAITTGVPGFPVRAPAPEVYALLNGAWQRVTLSFPAVIATEPWFDFLPSAAGDRLRARIRYERTLSATYSVVFDAAIADIASAPTAISLTRWDYGQWVLGIGHDGYVAAHGAPPTREGPSTPRPLVPPFQSRWYPLFDPQVRAPFGETYLLAHDQRHVWLRMPDDLYVRLRTP